MRQPRGSPPRSPSRRRGGRVQRFRNNSQGSGFGSVADFPTPTLASVKRLAAFSSSGRTSEARTPDARRHTAPMVRPARLPPLVATVDVPPETKAAPAGAAAGAGLSALSALPPMNSLARLAAGGTTSRSSVESLPASSSAAAGTPPSSPGQGAKPPPQPSESPVPFRQKRRPPRRRHLPDDARSPCHVRAPWCMTAALCWFVVAGAAAAVLLFVVKPGDVVVWCVAGGTMAVLALCCLSCKCCYSRWVRDKGATRLAYALSPGRMLDSRYMLGQNLPPGVPLERDVDEAALQVEATQPTLRWFFSPSGKNRVMPSSPPAPTPSPEPEFGAAARRLQRKLPSPPRPGTLLGRAITRARAAADEDASCAICLNSLAACCSTCEDEALLPAEERKRAPCGTVTGACGHTFHEDCIHRWIADCLRRGVSDPTCPCDQQPWRWFPAVDAGDKV